MFIFIDTGDLTSALLQSIKIYFWIIFAISLSLLLKKKDFTKFKNNFTFITLISLKIAENFKKKMIILQKRNLPFFKIFSQIFKSTFKEAEKFSIALKCKGFIIALFLAFNLFSQLTLPRLFLSERAYPVTDRFLFFDLSSGIYPFTSFMRCTNLRIGFGNIAEAGIFFEEKLTNLPAGKFLPQRYYKTFTMGGGILKLKLLEEKGKMIPAIALFGKLSPLIHWESIYYESAVSPTNVFYLGARYGELGVIFEKDFGKIKALARLGIYDHRTKIVTDGYDIQEKKTLNFDAGLAGYISLTNAITLIAEYSREHRLKFDCDNLKSDVTGYNVFALGIRYLWGQNLYFDAFIIYPTLYRGFADITLFLGLNFIYSAEELWRIIKEAGG